MRKNKNLTNNSRIGVFFRSLLQSFNLYKKKPAPLPDDIPPPVVAIKEKAPVAQMKQPPKKPEFSASEHYQLGLDNLQHEANDDCDILAFQHFLKAAEQEHAQAQSHLAYMYQMGYGTPKDAEKAFYWSFKAANQDIADAQFNVGLCYLNGWGTTVDVKQAIQWLQAAAQQNIVDAQRYLGDIYSGCLPLHSSDSFLDIDLAESWYLKAAASEDLHAQLQLGKLYLSDDNSKKNLSLAKKYLESAAQAHFEEAQYLLALYYLQPENNSKQPNYSVASDLLYQAAQNGYPDAMYALGCLYAEGKGVEENKALSQRYFQLAAKEGHRQAKQKLYEDFDIFADETSRQQYERTSVTVKLF